MLRRRRPRVINRLLNSGIHNQHDHHANTRRACLFDDDDHDTLKLRFRVSGSGIVWNAEHCSAWKSEDKFEPSIARRSV
jgi:hypothetical protein